MLTWHQECDWVTIPPTSYRQLAHSPSRLLSRTSEAVSPGSAALAGAIQLGGNLFERSTDDVDATSLLPVILEKGGRQPAGLTGAAFQTQIGEAD
jgi:hypothetical protein